MEKTKMPKQLESMKDVLQLMAALRYDVTLSESEKRYCHGITPRSFPYGMWFRGEGTHDTPLLPRVFREREECEECRYLNEPSLSNHIQSRINDLYQISNPFDRLCLAQHYNIPTRLLDWSESLLTAVYFACASEDEDESQKNKGANVFVLNALVLNKHGQGIGRGQIHDSEDFGTLFRAHMAFAFSASDWIGRINNHCPRFDWEKLKKEDNKYRKDYGHIDVKSGKQCLYYKFPIAVMPARTKHRMIVQSSVFVLHGGSYKWPKKDDCEPDLIPKNVPADEKSDKKIRVYKAIPIPSDAKSDLKKELFEFGIHKGTLFPEMDKQDEYLKTIW